MWFFSDLPDPCQGKISLDFRVEELPRILKKVLAMNKNIIFTDHIFTYID